MATSWNADEYIEGCSSIRGRWVAVFCKKGTNQYLSDTNFWLSRYPQVRVIWLGEEDFATLDIGVSPTTVFMDGTKETASVKGLAMAGRIERHLNG